MTNTKICRVCNQEKPIELFAFSRPKVYRTICKICDTERIKLTLRRTKIKAIQYKGGKCQCCGYDKYFGALDFHHLDPSQKNHDKKFKISSMKFDNIKTELDKCLLVCSNCHREIHGGIRRVDFMVAESGVAPKWPELMKLSRHSDTPHGS